MDGFDEGHAINRLRQMFVAAMMLLAGNRSRSEIWLSLGAPVRKEPVSDEAHPNRRQTHEYLFRNGELSSRDYFPRVFFETEAGKAVWGGADNFFFLKMSPDNVRYHKENSSLLGSAPLEIVASLETKPNEYAEVFYTNKTGTHQGAFRYIQSSLDRVSSANSERDKEALTDGSA